MELLAVAGAAAVPETTGAATGGLATGPCAALPPVTIASSITVTLSDGATAEGATVELLHPVTVVDAGGGLATAAASAAAFLSLRPSAVASRALFAAASCDSDC